MNRKIGLIDADLLDGGTRFPNLALMKLSAYYKQQGCRVELIENTAPGIEAQYGRVFLSKVFDYTRVDPELLKKPNVEFGGSGTGNKQKLPDPVEFIMPDYHLYDEFIKKQPQGNGRWKNYEDASIGFTTRGCFRKCAFCINSEEDSVRFHAHVDSFLDPERKRIILLDDNILGYKGWRNVFNELEESGKPFQFKQGLDIRLLTLDKARVLARARYHRDFIFAFDDLRDEALIKEKLRLWRGQTDHETKLYVLAGFEDQGATEIESVFKRIEIIGSFGCIPYVMRHKNYLTSPYKGMFVQIARWANQPGFFKKLTFREFCLKDQSLMRTEKTGAAMRALNQFESDNPEIAKKYFDKKYWG